MRYEYTIEDVTRYDDHGAADEPPVEAGGAASTRVHDPFTQETVWSVWGSIETFDTTGVNNSESKEDDFVLADRSKTWDRLASPTDTLSRRSKIPETVC